MGGSESTEADVALWEEIKKTPDKIRQNNAQLFALCIDWNNFNMLIPSGEIRAFFVADLDAFLSLTSCTIAYLQDSLAKPIESNGCLLGAVHLLSRLFPLMFELSEEKRYEYLWSGESPLGVTVCSCVGMLFFKEDFCIQRSVESSLWHSGVMCDAEVHDKEPQFHLNRLSVVRLMLVMSSSLLYYPTKSVKDFFDPVMCLFCSQWNMKAKEILFSLVNFALNYDASSYSIPLIGEVNENSLNLAINSLQLACSLLHLNLPTDDQFSIPSLKAVKTIVAKDSLVNTFEEALKSIDDYSDCAKLYKGIKKLLEKSLDANPERCLIKEGFIFLNKLTVVCPQFFSSLALYSYDFDFMLMYISEHIGFFSRPGGNQPLAYLVLCILQRLSAYTQFAHSLNKKCDKPTKKFMTYTGGSFFDCFIVFIRNLILKYNARLELAGFGLISILSNMAPHVKGLTQSAAEGLLDVLEDCIEKPKPYSENCVSFLIKTIVDLIHYHLRENYAIVVELVKREELVEEMAKLKDNSRMSNEVGYLLDIVKYFLNLFSETATDLGKCEKVKSEVVIGISRYVPKILKNITTIDNNWLVNYIWATIFYSEVQYFIDVLDSQKIQLISLSKSE